MYQPEKVVTSVSTDSKQREVGYLGKQVFELSNHLGNILATITDKKLQVSTNTTSTDYFEADVQTVQDYYAFGMQMPGRKLSGGYRYGFNGKENDNEVKGEGNSQDYGMRIYDGRIGKFLSVDPLTKGFPQLTPYQFASNSPIANIDLDGLERIHFTRAKEKDGSTKLTLIGNEDFSETKWDPGYDGKGITGYHLFKTTTNPRVEYVVHQMDEMIFYANADLKKIPYDESVSYRSLEAAQKSVDGDFVGTSQDLVWGGVSAVSVSAQNIRDGYRPIRSSPSKIISKQGAAAHESNTEGAKANVAPTNEQPPSTYNRVKPRVSTLKQVEQNQPRNSQGQMIDPNTKNPLKPGQIDLGHKPGQEWYRRKEMHKQNGSSRKQVIEAENNPNLYQFEDRSTNRSRKYENKN
jgi:RHS repeat-associated protein